MAFYGNSNSVEVKDGMHQGSALSPLLFVIVMEALSRQFRVALPWELLSACINHNLGFIHIYYHTSILHDILPFIKPFN